MTEATFYFPLYSSRPSERTKKPKTIFFPPSLSLTFTKKKMATLIPPNGAGDAEKESCTSPSSLRPSSWVHSIQGSQTDLDSTSPSIRKQEGAASPRISSDLAGTDTDTDTDEHEEPPLPYSKARCVALVVTTTGAAFTNVSIPHSPPRYFWPSTHSQYCTHCHRFYQSKQS